jgi:hypothetical protein
LAFFIYILNTIKGVFFNTAGSVSSALHLPWIWYSWFQFSS